MGRLVGDTVECGYRGLAVGRTGQCVHAPACTTPPERATVRSYPCEERYGLIWVWMGTPEQADPDEIIVIDQWTDPQWWRSEEHTFELQSRGHLVCSLMHANK